MLENQLVGQGERTRARHAFRVGLLGRPLGVTAALSSNSSGDAGDGRESLEALVSMTMASTFSWELRGSTASLLGTGVMVEGRFAKDSELLFVVSLRHDDLLLSLEAVGVLLEFGVVLEAFGWVADFEKKPRMLCCFPVDACVLEGVLAGAAAFSPILAGSRSIDRSDGYKTKVQMLQRQRRAPTDKINS